AKVIIGCRDTEKGRKAAENIRRQVPEANVIVKHLDLASFSSIRQFAAEILKSEPRIHILINNAGDILSHSFTSLLKARSFISLKDNYPLKYVRT
ncbi:hypothetical protein AVEN_129011-1, partial [Araneus ventricosus]